MFDENIPSADQKDMNEMLKEGEKMGLSPEDLVSSTDSTDDKFGKQPVNFIPPGLGEAGDNQPKKPVKKEQPATQPEAGQEEGEEKKPNEVKEEPAEGEGEGQPSPESGKFLTKGEFGKFNRDLKKQFGDLTEAISNLAKAKTEGKQDAAREQVEEQVDEFMAYAQEFKDDQGRPLNADALKKLASIIQNQILKLIPLDKLKGLDQIQPIVSQMSESMHKEQIIADFNAEWEGEQPNIAKAYPNATPEQWKKAKALMRELATGETYGLVEGKHEAYPLAHILAIEAAKFKDILFSPKKKTAETGQLADGEIEDNPNDILSTQHEDMTPQKAEKLSERLNAGMQ